MGPDMARSGVVLGAGARCRRVAEDDFAVARVQRLSESPSRVPMAGMQLTWKYRAQSNPVLLSSIFNEIPFMPRGCEGHNWGVSLL